VSVESSERRVDAPQQIRASRRALTGRTMTGLGRCKGAFNPRDALAELIRGDGDSNVQIEEVNCMNMCKRGPNVRLVGLCVYCSACSAKCRACKMRAQGGKWGLMMCSISNVGFYIDVYQYGVAIL